MVSLRAYDEKGYITPLGAVLSCLGVVSAVGGIATNVIEYVKNRPAPPLVLPLEPDAIDAEKYGTGFTNADREGNGMRESYFADPATGIRYRVTLNPLTKEFTFIRPSE